MTKTIKRTLAIVMAVAMLFALSVMAFAAQPDQQQSNITVYARVQTADSSSGYDPLGSLSNIVDRTVYTGETQVTYDGFSYIAVTLPANSTVKTLINTYLSHTTIVNSCDCVSGGCTHTTYGCTCSSSTCTCTWKQVENVDWNGSAYVPNGTYSSALNSLNYNGTTRTNNGGSYYDDDEGCWFYSGNAWNYYVDGGYPESLYMSQYVLTAGEHVAISFDHSSFSF
ncbi:MAG: hypothetical protein IKO68_02195 [Oscillospiraceae bacterium]|nr:hypothetical protein [Oscillospiraceae bacterium]